MMATGPGASVVARATRAARLRAESRSDSRCTYMEDSMLRNLVFVVASAAALILSSVAFGQTAQYGTAEDARAMLEKAVAAVKADKTKALEMFNRGEGGFKDRDL